MMIWLLVVLAALTASPAPQNPPPSLEHLRRQAQQMMNPADGVEVCNVALVPSRSVPNLYIASVDMSGRRFCNEVVVIGGGEKPKWIATIDTWWLDEVDSAVRDLDGDGNGELVIPTSMSSYEGVAACVAIFERVYRCGASGCKDVSTQYPNFYAAKSARIKTLIAAAERQPDTGHADPIPCLQMTETKIARVIRHEPTAGLDLAQKWAVSPDEYLRRKAIFVLSDIETADSTALLEGIARGDDRTLAEMAARIVERRRRGER